jgi:hypothetical protein
MAGFATFYASKKLELGLRVVLSSPDLQAAELLVAIEAASVTSDFVNFEAVNGQMPNLVTLEADLLRARKRVMRVFATQYARGSLGLVGAFARPVATFSAVLAPQKRVLPEEVPRLHLLHHLVEFSIALLVFLKALAFLIA